MELVLGNSTQTPMDPFVASLVDRSSSVWFGFCPQPPFPHLYIQSTILFFIHQSSPSSLSSTRRHRAVFTMLQERQLLEALNFHPIFWGPYFNISFNFL
ncbi:unnamed protein product [Brassica oleracea var. botrytis]|uniref:(rape) hypothetical protein n=1 Tax=Brassica napus TaxID=3708 RepID=A0A816QTV2_BRANA|nr:unnamed protein product [Brassica napus]